MLQKYFGESTLSRTQVFKCHKAFSEGREVIENLPHASRPSTTVNDDNIEKVKKIVSTNLRVGIREVAEALNISYSVSALRCYPHTENELGSLLARDSGVTRSECACI